MVPPSLVLLLLLAGPSVLAAEESSCYSGGSVTGAVLGTVLAIFLLQAALYFVWNMYWKGKSGQHLVLVTDPEKGESIFAFDNPGFKEGPNILPNGEKENQNTKIKWTQWTSNQVVGTPNSKGKSMDDTYITSSAPLTNVPLKSHDFTGLGFNICGNMRDGIFVKDVLHRGPASESGRIMPGDRIDSIKINFRHMVFEDALTIMSYASPYEVEMSVESRNASNTSSLLRTPPPPHKISHPLYRSQSISDLHKISKPNSRRMGDQPSSLLSDISGEVKYSTLDRKPKVAEPERTQNTRNCIIENVQKHENTFHEVELSRVEEDEVDHRKETPSPGNVKSILVKGIQNLKEKLHNSLHQDESKDETKGSTMVNISAQNTLEKKKQSSEGFETVELNVPNVPKEVEKAGISARNRRSTIEEDFDLSDNEDPVAAKRNKRKAPKPSPTPEDEGSVNHHSLEPVDSDSENGDKKSGTTIELNSSHITVHHVPESESRKASSLGDLSRYEAENVILLERAVSLDLGDGAPGNKKRKAPMPPQESCPFKEARMETGGTGTLKKSSVWGTLEDVIQNGSDSSDVDLGISGCSTPEKSELITSTPFKFPTSMLNSENDVTNVEISNYNWDISLHDTSDFITALNGDETPPELPTSPMPTMSTFITEIQVTSIKPTNENEVIHLDSTQQLFDHMKSHKLDLESINDEDSTISPESPKSSPEPMIVDEVKKENAVINHEAFSTIQDKQQANNSSHTEVQNYHEERQIYETGRVNHKENGISPEESQMKSEEENVLNHVVTRVVKNDEPQLHVTHDENSNREIIRDVIITDSKSQKTSPVQRTEIVKPSRSGVTVTSIKTSPSRIPVRAGPRSPGAGTSRNTIQRNGHTSP